MTAHLGKRAFLSRLVLRILKDEWAASVFTWRNLFCSVGLDNLISARGSHFSSLLLEIIAFFADRQSFVFFGFVFEYCNLLRISRSEIYYTFCRNIILCYNFKMWVGSRLCILFRVGRIIKVVVKHRQKSYIFSFFLPILGTPWNFNLVCYKIYTLFFIKYYIL